jgi:hypothetical protein
MYIKVQLDNPSFVRGEGGRSEVRVELLVDDEGEPDQRTGATQSARGAAEDQEQLARDMARLEIDRAKNQQKQRQGQANALLAAERGEGGFLGQDGRVEVTIREKTTTDEQVVPPSREDDAHLMLEGYKTTFGTGRKPGEKANADSDKDSDDDDDDFPTIRL